jgi:hypothetical protein
MRRCREKSSRGWGLIMALVASLALFMVADAAVDALAKSRLWRDYHAGLISGETLMDGLVAIEGVDK